MATGGCPRAQAVGWGHSARGARGVAGWGAGRRGAWAEGRGDGKGGDEERGAASNLFQMEKVWELQCTG